MKPVTAFLSYNNLQFSTQPFSRCDRLKTGLYIKTRYIRNGLMANLSKSLFK